MQEEDWRELPTPFGAPPVPVAAVEPVHAAVVLGVQGERSVRAKERKTGGAAASKGERSGGAEANEGRNKKARLARSAEKKEKQDPLPLSVLAKLADPKHKSFYPDHKYLAANAEGAQIWCNACGSGFGTRKNVWQKHLNADRHVSNVKLAKERDEGRAVVLKQPTMDESVKAQAAATEKRRRLSEAVQLHRKRVARALMASGIPITSLSKDLIELLSEQREQRLGLGDLSNLMRDFGKELAEEALKEDQDALRGQDIAICYDTTPGRDDIALVVARTCSEDWTIRHRLVAVRLFEKSLTAENTVRLVDSVREELLVPRNNILVGLSDGCNTMMATARTLAINYARYNHVFCLPHALSKVLPRFVFPQLPNFVRLYNAVFKNSFSGRAVFQRHTGITWKRGHKIRWNASHVQHKQILDSWDKLGAVFNEMFRENMCKETLPELKGFFDGQCRKSSDLYVQLVACVEGADPFVRATAFLEGDGFLAPFVTPKVSELRQFVDAISTAHSPPLLQMPRASVTFASFTDGAKTKLWRETQASLRPGFDYLYQLNRGDEVGDSVRYQRSLQLFRFAYLLHPGCAKVRQEGFRIAEEFTDPVQFFLGEALVAELMSDFPLLMSAYREVETVKMKPEELLNWWKEHGAKTKSWARAARMFTLLQPTSALAERAGAILRSRVSDQQANMLEETTELYCKYAYRAAEEKGKKKKDV